jgi:hypothetical protein
MASAIQFRLTGGAANADPNASLGGTRSSVQVSAIVLNNLFADVTPAQAAAGATHYRAIDLFNSGDAQAGVVKAYTDPNTTSTDTTIELGGDALESSLSIANETTAPVGISFQDYTTSSRLSCPNIPVGQGFRLWVKRIVSPGALNMLSDEATIVVEFA